MPAPDAEGRRGCNFRRKTLFSPPLAAGYTATLHYGRKDP